MTDEGCPRLWEVEAARDGRLDAVAHKAQRSHLQRCAPCAAEQARLAGLAERLRAGSGDQHDEIRLRRTRERILALANRQWLAGASGPRWPRGLIVLALSLGSVVAAGALLLRAADAPERLRLTASEGARYRHVRDGDHDVVHLDHGRLAIEYHRGKVGGLRVHVPDGEIRDLGTAFGVAVEAGQTREISVQDGAVVFRRARAGNVIITAGEVFRVEPPTTVAVAAEAPAADAADRALVPAAAAPARADRHPNTKPNAPASPPTAASSAEKQDLAYLRILALLQEGRPVEARVAARQYLSEFPNGFRRREVLHIAQGGSAR